MVNTFLLDRDFRISASKLNRDRLGKQRVEAYQILIVLKQYRFLARYFGLPDFPVGENTSKETRRAWVNLIVQTFKASGLIGLHLRGGLIIQYRVGATLPRRPESGNSLHYDSSTGTVYEVKGARKTVVASGHWSQFVLPGEELVTTRIRISSAIDMWLGFEEALKDYINAHIEVWASRGYRNTMQTYTVGSYPRPAWTQSEEVIRNFKSTLIEREIERLEPAWYMRQADFIDSWVHSPENGELLKSFSSQLPHLQWWLFAPRESLLTLGRFPGFIWP